MDIGCPYNVFISISSISTLFDCTAFVSIEHSGWLQTWNEHGKLGDSRNSVQPQGKIVTSKVFLVRHSNICVKQLITG